MIILKGPLADLSEFGILVESEPNDPLNIFVCRLVRDWCLTVPRSHSVPY